MNEAQRLELTLLMYRQIYYLANADKWTGVYLENRKRVVSKPPRTSVPWSAEDDRVLRRLYPHHETAWIAGQLNRTVPSIYAHAGNLGLAKTPEFQRESLTRLGKHLAETGAGGRFLKGHAPANKGTRRPGYSPGRMGETQFKKGRGGHNTMPLFSERLVDGYVYIKVAEVQCVPYTVNWLLLHILNWERANGRPLPPGHCLWFKDRNRANPDPENLELITRAENMRRNTVHNLPKELVRVVQLRGALVRQINRRNSLEQQNRRPARSPVRNPQGASR